MALCRVLLTGTGSQYHLDGLDVNDYLSASRMTGIATYTIIILRLAAPSKKEANRRTHLKSSHTIELCMLKLWRKSHDGRVTQSMIQNRTSKYRFVQLLPSSPQRQENLCRLGPLIAANDPMFTLTIVRDCFEKIRRLTVAKRERLIALSEEEYSDESEGEDEDEDEDKDEAEESKQNKSDMPGIPLLDLVGQKVCGSSSGSSNDGYELNDSDSNGKTILTETGFDRTKPEHITNKTTYARHGVTAFGIVHNASGLTPPTATVEVESTKPDLHHFQNTDSIGPSGTNANGKATVHQYDVDHEHVFKLCTSECIPHFCRVHQNIKAPSVILKTSDWLRSIAERLPSESQQKRRWLRVPSTICNVSDRVRGLAKNLPKKGISDRGYLHVPHVFSDASDGVRTLARTLHGQNAQLDGFREAQPHCCTSSTLHEPSSMVGLSFRDHALQGYISIIDLIEHIRKTSCGL